MARTVVLAEPDFPWVDHQEDRRFRRFSIIMVVVFLVTGIGINLIQLPEVERKALIDISPRLAKLILEKKKVEPPPKVEKKPEAKKKQPEKKKEVKKKQPEKKKTKPKKKTDREVAQNAGLLQLSDELEDLRDLFDVDDVATLPQQTAGKQEIKVASTSDLLSAGAQQSSGGIKTDTLNRKLKTSELTQRQTTRVESKIESDQNKLAKAETSSSSSGSQSGAGKRRTSNEVERVFQKNKSSIFNLYNRALRKNPSLAGKVVIELTIAPDGSVSSAKILSSELGDKALERKLILRIKKFRFSNASFAETTVTYPIDFLPS